MHGSRWWNYSSTAIHMVAFYCIIDELSLMPKKRIYVGSERYGPVSYQLGFEAMSLGSDL